MIKRMSKSCVSLPCLDAYFSILHPVCTRFVMSACQSSSVFSSLAILMKFWIVSVVDLQNWRRGKLCQRFWPFCLGIHYCSHLLDRVCWI